MPGKNTGKNGLHASRMGGIVEHITITDGQLTRLASILGRNLGQLEIEQTEDLLSIYRSMKTDALSDRVSSQDIKRTIGAIAAASPEKAKVLFGNCDDSTYAELSQSLYLTCGLKFFGREAQHNPPTDLIILAAQDALTRVSEQERNVGRPENGYQRMITKFAVSSWQRLGRSDVEVRYTPPTEIQRQNGSPLQQWAMTLFEIVDNRCDGSQVKKLLIRELESKVNPR